MIFAKVKLAAAMVVAVAVVGGGGAVDVRQLAAAEPPAARPAGTMPDSARYKVVSAAPLKKEDREHYLLPRPQEIAWLDEAAFGRPKSVEVVVLEPAEQPVKATAGRVAAAMECLLGAKVAVTTAKAPPQVSATDVARVVFGRSGGDYLKMCQAKGLEAGKLANEQSYFLWTGPGLALVAAPKDQGLVFGGTTLIQLLRIGYCSEPAGLPGCRIHDWPDNAAARSLTYDIADSRAAPDWIPAVWEWLADLCSESKGTHFGLYMEGYFDFKCLPMPFRQGAKPIDAQKAQAFSEYAWDRGLRAFPLTNWAAHSTFYNQAVRTGSAQYPWAGKCGAFCPTSEESYALLDKIMGELADAFPHADFIHVGGDEVGSFSTPCPACRKLEEDKREAAGQPREIGKDPWCWRYVTFMNRLNELAKKHGRVAAFWADPILKAHPKTAEALEKDTVPWIWDGSSPFEMFSPHNIKTWKSTSWWCPHVVPNFKDRRGGVRYPGKPQQLPKGCEANNATSWGEVNSCSYYLFEPYFLAAWLDGLWSVKGGHAESFDKAFALQVLGVNDPEAARALRDAPYRIRKDSGPLSGALNVVLQANKGLSGIVAQYGKCKDEIAKLRGKWSDADPDIKALAEIEKRVPDPRARIYVYCVYGQARQIQQAARIWDHLAQVSELYAKARAEKDVAARKKLLDEASVLIEALLPFYDFLADFHKRCLAETGMRPDHADVRDFHPFKTRDDLKALSAKLAELVAGGGELPAPESLNLFPQ